MELYIAYAVIYGFVFITGACIGSFLNVLIYRIPRKIDFTKGRSVCPNCDNTLSPGDLVPLVSYLFLKGKCRYCGSPISFRYPLVEFLGGALGLFSVLFFGMTWQAGLVFVVSCILLTVAFIDMDTMEIPDALNIALLIMAVISIFLFKDVSLVSHVIGIFVVSIPMLLMNFLVQDSFGGGDIKLCAVCGLMLGWQQMLVAGFIALLTGGLFGAFLLLSRRKGRKEHFAFGPFLSFGIMIALFLGMTIFESYLTLFNI